MSHPFATDKPKLRQRDARTELSYTGRSPLTGQPMPVTISYPWPLTKHAERIQVMSPKQPKPVPPQPEPDVPPQPEETPPQP
jgi:hypothetical protein